MRKCCAHASMHLWSWLTRVYLITVQAWISSLPLASIPHPHAPWYVYILFVYFPAKCIARYKTLPAHAYFSCTHSCCPSSDSQACLLSREFHPQRSRADTNADTTFVRSEFTKKTKAFLIKSEFTENTEYSSTPWTLNLFQNEKKEIKRQKYIKFRSSD